MSENHPARLIPFSRPLRYLTRWMFMSLLAGILAGSSSALLLWLLSLATDVREGHPWIISLLPAAGMCVGFLYWKFGRSVSGGNNLILEQIHHPTHDIPLRMAFMILLGTFLTHLFGGSAGREGTAIQAGAALADQLARPFRMQAHERRLLLMAGISAGFASVFGTPLAGAVFGLEVLRFRSIDSRAILPCFVAAFVGNQTAHFLGAHHTIYLITAVPAFTVRTVLFASVAGVTFGCMARAFTYANHTLSHQFERRIGWPPLRPVVGGVLVACAVAALGTTKYIGLGIPTIVAAFHGQQPPYDFAGKFLFTVITLASGFKGGEVTPLFFIGATLGNAISHFVPLPASLLAGMGFVAVFAGAAKTPFTSTLMALELFGADAAIYAAIACVISYLASGQAGIHQAHNAGRERARDERVDALAS